MNATGFLARYRMGQPATLATLSMVHGLVDTVDAALVFSLVHSYPLSGGEYLRLVIVYNALAFALQPICGILVDRYKAARLSALIGILVSLAALLTVLYSPLCVVLLAGTGNALFHVGGGVTSMMMRPDRAGPPGLFVAPGALGIAIGALIGSTGRVPVQPVIILLVAATIAVTLGTFPVDERGVEKKGRALLRREGVIVLLLLSVALRSLLGFSVGSFWQENRMVLLAFAIAAMLGKGAGGYLSDRFGWTTTGTMALVLSVVLFGFGTRYAWCSIFGMLLLQMTMPVTLTALYRVFPGRPGLVFGLCCLALVVGAGPALSPWATSLRNSMVVVLCAVSSVVTFYKALKMVSGIIPDSV